MRVLGYSFREPTDAERVRAVLMERFGLRPDDARLGDLAEDGIVLGIRAREENVAEVERLLGQHGGTPLTDVEWTGLQPRS